LLHKIKKNSIIYRLFLENDSTNLFLTVNALTYTIKSGCFWLNFRQGSKINENELLFYVNPLNSSSFLEESDVT